MKILCVCLGNICRSPTAEGVLKKIIEKNNLKNIEVDSAGTSSWHEGEPPDGRSAYYASLRGYDLSGQKSRQIKLEDFEDFDLILAMDSKNYSDLLKMSPEHEGKIKLLTSYCVIHDTKKFPNGVPDPYYDGENGFKVVLDLIEDASSEIVKELSLKEQ